MSNFFENLNDLFSAWAKGLQDSQKQNQQNQGAGTSAPSFESVGSTLLGGIGDAVSSAWTGFLNKAQESNKQNIQAGNYTTNPETVHLESPFGNHDNLAQRATAEIQQGNQQFQIEPWKSKNPFQIDEVDKEFEDFVYELYDLNPNTSRSIKRDAYDLFSSYVQDVFASNGLGVKSPKGALKESKEEAKDRLRGLYTAEGKSGKEIEGLLQAQEGWQTEKQHRESQEKNVISAAAGLRDTKEPGWSTAQGEKETEREASAWERLGDMAETVQQRGVGGLSDYDADIFLEFADSPEGRALLDKYQRGEATADDLADYGAKQAGALRESQQPKGMTYEEAEKYLREANPMYSLAKDTQGQMDDYAAAYGDLAGLYRRGMAGEYEAMTPAEQYAYHDLSGAEGFEWLFDPEIMENPAGLSEDQLRQITDFGKTRAQQMEEAKGLFSPYEMTPYQQGLWEQYVNTPEGAAQWAEDAKGTKDEEKARDNLWFVTREAKFAEIEGRADFQEISKPDEALLGKDRVYSAVNGVTMGPDAAQMWASVPNAMGMVSTASPETQHYIDIASGLDEHERLAYNAIVREQGLSAGLEYLRYKEYEVNERRTKEMATAFQTFGESGVGGAIGASALSVPLSIARGVGYLDMVGQNFANWVTGLLGGEQKPVDRYSAAQLPGMLADSAREGVQNQVDWNVNILGQDVDVFDFLYGTAMSGIDSFTAGQLGAALGGIANSAEKAQKLASWTGAAILGGGAAQSAMQDAYDRGANDGTALLLGVIAGANETLWEHWSIGNLIKHGQDVGKKTFAEEIKNAFAEAGVNASEEFNTSLANGIAEYFLNHDDREVQKKADEYERLGLSPEAALEKARGEFWASAVMDAAGGALMGGVFGSVENVQNRQNVNRVDKAVGSGFSSESMDTLYSLAESEGASDKAKKLARKFPKEKANAKQMGELFRELSNTMGAGIREALHNMGVADIALQIGQETGAMDKAAAEAVTAMMQGENLNGEQVAALAANPAAMKIVDALFKPDTQAKGEAAGTGAEAGNTVSGAAERIGREPVKFEPMPGMEMPGKIDTSARGAAAGRAAAPKINVQTVIGKDKSAAAQRIESIDEDEGGGVRVKLEDGQSVDLEDAGLSAPMQEVARAAAGMDRDKAAAMMNAAEEALKKGTEGVTSSVTPDGATPSPQGEGSEESKRLAADVAAGRDFALGFSAVYDAAAKGQTREQVRTVYGEQLQEDVREKAYEAGRQAFERLEEQARQRNMEEAKTFGFRTVAEATSPAPGGATSPDRGGPSGVLFDRVGDSLRDKDGNVNNGKLLALKLIDRVFKQTRMQARVVDKLENDANGKYVHGTNIVYLSMDAEEGAITKAASHEGFHFISQFSPDMAKTITDFVMDKLGKVDGYDIEQRIKEVQERYKDGAGQELGRDGAIEEIVADSMLDVIGTRENMEQLMKQSKSTAEKIKEWITNTYQKFKDILNRLAKGSPEVAALKDDVDYLGRISSMWQEGMRQAAEAWRQAQVGYNDGSAALEQNQAVQQYRQEMQGDMTVDDRENSLTAFLAQLFMDTQGQWIQAHMDEYEEGLAKYRQALLEYKRGGVALNVALERAGLSPLSGNDIRVASYAADQVMTQEGAKERAKEKAAGVKYSFKGRDGKDLTVSDGELNKNKDEVANMEAIASVVGNAFPRTEGQKLSDRLDNYFKSIGGSVYSEEFGEIVLGRDGAKHFEAKVNPKAAAAIPLIAEVIKKGKLVDVDPNHANKGFPSITLAAAIKIDHKPYYMGVSIRQIKYGDNRYYVHNVVAEDIETLNKNGGNSDEQTRAAQSVGDRDTENPHYLYNILQDLVKRKQNLKNSEKNNSVSSYSLPSRQRQEADAAESVKQDAELYAQIRQDADSRAALELLMRMHEQTTQGGENALIKPGAFEKRLGEMVAKIKEDTATKMGDRTIRKELRTIYQAMEKPGYSVGEILTYAKEFYQQVLEQAPGALVEMDDSTREAVRVLRENPFQLTPDQKSEIKGTYGSLGDFMRKNFGKLKIRNGAKVTLADVWRESLNPLNPGLFAEDTAEADMPGIIDAFLENAHAKKFAGEFGANIGAMSTDGALNLMLDFYDVPGAYKQKSEVRAEYQERFDNARALVNQYRQEARQAMNTARAEYQQKYRERLEKDRQTKAEREAKQGVINEIKRNVKPLKTMLVKGTDNRHIPEAMRGAMERMLNNLGVDRAIFSGQEAKELYMKLKKWAADSQLHDAAEAAAYDPDILAKLEWLEEHAGKSKALRDMTMQELEAVRDAVQNMYKMVMEENEIEVAGRKLKVSALAENVMGQMKDKKDASSHPVLAFLRKVGFKEMTPVYYAKQVGGTLGDLINDIIRSESDVAFIIKDAKAAFDKAAEKYNLNEWIHDKNHLRFQTDAGDTIELTREQAMTLYAWAEREKRNKTQSAAHLRRGGFTYDRNDKDVKQMKGVNFTKSHVLSVGDLAQIRNYLTDEQRGFVETMVKYLSENMAEKGNEASMRMFGWKKFGEKWYFPYPTDRNFRGKNTTDAKGQPDKQIKYMGSSHALTEKAMNPLKLGNFTDIWAGHVDEMARYSVMAEKLDNLQRVTNYVVAGSEKVDNETGVEDVIAPESVKKEIERALGQEGAHYLEQFIRDANGGVMGDERGLSDKFISLFKKGSVAANMSVILQQPSAFVRAMSMVNPRYFGKGMHEHGGYKATRERMYANSGVANLKQWGGFDTNTGGSFANTLLDSVEKDGKLEKTKAFIDEWTGKGAEKADEITWVYMYSAIEAEIDDRTDYQRGTEDFNRAVAQRFDEVMRATQVYDSSMAKSEWMRSTSTMDKVVTSFMAEPTLWINMMMDAALDLKNNAPGARGKAARAVGVFVAGTFVNSLLQSIATAFRRKKDEGTTMAEKYLAELASSFTDSLSIEGIAGMIPIARDIVSLFQGYDVERADMAVIGNMIDAWRKMEQHMKKGEMPDVDEWMNLAGMAANMFGIPLRNVWRDASGIWKNVMPDTVFYGGGSSPIGETNWRDIMYSVLDETSWNSFVKLWDPSNAAYYDRMEQALIKGDMKQYEELRGYMEETKLVKPDSIDKGIKKEIKESVLGGLISDEKAMDMLKNHFGMDQQKAYYTVDSWQQTEKNKDTENYSYSREGALMAAVKAGQDVKEEMKKLTDNGYTEKELKSDMKSQIGKWYRSGEMTRQEAESKLQKYTGETDRDNMYWLFDKWDYMRKNGSDEGYGKYNTLYELIDTGRDMRQEVQRIVSHGVKPESVSSAITAKYKETYVSLYRSGKTAEAANLKAKLLNALEAAGLNRETKNKAIEYWLKDKQ